MKPLPRIFLCLLWMAFLFYQVSRPPETPAPFPEQFGPLTPSRSIYNPTLAAALDEDLRDFWQKPDQVLDMLEPLMGATVADIGSGEGYFTLRLLERVKAGGKVIATDIQPDVLHMLESRIPEPYRDRVALVLGSETSLGFEEKVDLALLVQVFGEVEDQRGLLAQIREVMHRHSRLALIDSKHVTDPVTGYTRPLNLNALMATLDQAGFELIPGYRYADYNFLPKQFFFALRLKREAAE